MLEALRKPSTAPRRPSVVQLYLAENKERIAEIYNVRAPTAEKTGIYLRNVIASELLNAESEEVKAEWEKRADQEYAAAMSEFAMAQEGGPSDDPEVQEE